MSSNLINERQASVDSLLKAFECKVDASIKICNLEILEQTLRKLKERPSVRGKGRITSLDVLRDIVHAERERIVLDITSSYQPDQLIKYVDWFFQFWEYLKGMKRQFDEKIHGPLKSYFVSNGFTPSVSRSSFASDQAIELQLGPDVNVLQLSHDGNIQQSGRQGVYTKRLKEEFKQLGEIYDNAEIKGIADTLLNVTETWNTLLDEKRELLEETDEEKLSSEHFSTPSPQRDVACLILLISSILGKCQKSAQLARRWLEVYKNKTKHLNDKLKKITDLQKKMSSKLRDIEKDLDNKEKQITQVTKELDRLVKREGRSDEIKHQMYEIERNEKIVKELLHIANQQRHEIGQMMLAPDQFDSEELENLKLKYEENKLKRYVLDKKLKAIKYSKELLNSDFETEMAVKPSIIRHTNDTQETCEKLEETLEENRKLKREIEAALGPLKEEKEYLEMELLTCPPAPDFEKEDLLFYRQSKSNSYLSTPDKEKVDDPVSNPIVDTVSDDELDSTDFVTKEVDAGEPDQKSSIKPTDKTKESTVKHPPWQFTFKPTTLGKMPQNNDGKSEKDIPEKQDGGKSMAGQNDLKSMSRPKPQQRKAPKEQKETKPREGREEHRAPITKDKEPNKETHTLDDNYDKNKTKPSVSERNPEEKQKTIKALIRLPSHTLLPSEVQSAFHTLKEDTFTLLNKKYQYKQDTYDEDKESGSSESEENGEESKTQVKPLNVHSYHKKPKSILKGKNKARTETKHKDAKGIQKKILDEDSPSVRKSAPPPRDHRLNVIHDKDSKKKTAPTPHYKVESKALPDDNEGSKDKRKAQNNNTRHQTKSPRRPFVEPYRPAAVYIGSTKKNHGSSAKDTESVRVSIPKYTSQDNPTRVHNPVQEGNVDEVSRVQTEKEGEKTKHNANNKLKEGKGTVDQPPTKVRFDDSVDVVTRDKDKRDGLPDATPRGGIHRKGSTDSAPWYQQEKII